MKIQVLEFNIGELQAGRYPLQVVETGEHIALNLQHAAVGRASAWNIILIFPEETPEPLRSYSIAQRKITALEAAFKSGVLTRKGAQLAAQLIEFNYAEIAGHDPITF